MFSLAQGRDTSSYSTLESLLGETLNQIEARVERGDEVTGTATGFSELDRILAGLQPNNLIVVGARPAMGKTSFGLNIAAHAAMETSAPVLFFSRNE